MADTVQIDDYAHRLLAASGDRAEYEAAQRAKACADRGDHARAEQWRKVRANVRTLRGARVS